MSDRQDDLRKFNEIMQPEHNEVKTGGVPLSLGKTIVKLIVKGVRGK
jgi:hypothetical protein